MGKKYVGILTILGMIGLIVAISGCTSTSASTYNGSQMSFQYPSDSQIKELGSAHDGSSVAVKKDNKTEAAVTILSDLESAKVNMTAGSDYTKSQGQQTINGVSCAVYKTTDGIYYYLFEKNGKQFSVMCGDASQDVAKQIIQTIK
nr:hypothetical protein [uncultured Methanobacterium sp.]